VNRIVILVVEDEAGVRSAMLRDLRVFAEVFRVEAAADAAEAAEVVAEASDAGDRIGLVLCDHLLPGRYGTEFLVELNGDPSTRSAKKVLVTGQAGHEDTIRAINEADLDHYIAKPWTRQALHDVVRRQLTDLVIESGIDPLPYVAVLEGDRLLEAARNRTWDR
jgi:two-component system chemotaxis response regulator CheY